MLLGYGLKSGNEYGSQRDGADEAAGQTDQAFLLRIRENSLSLAYNAGLVRAC
jgi:hypothetical protein